MTITKTPNKIYLVWFKRKEWPAWAAEDPTYNKDEAEDHVQQAKMLGMEARMQAIYITQPKD